MIVNSLSFIDIIFSLILVGLILLLASFFKPKSNKNLGKYYFPFIVSKICFATIFVLIHVYYYKGGDTFLYFSGASYFADQFYSDPLQYFRLMFSSQESLTKLIYSSKLVYALNSSKDVFFLSKIVSPFCIFGGNNYLASNILYTSITAIGVWKIYTTFYKLYPLLYKYFAFGILFYPSLGIWGSGILKDPLTLCCVGLIFFSTYNLTLRKKALVSLSLTIVSAYFCFVLKPYILYTFIPIMLIWAQGRITKQLKNATIKIIVSPILITVFFIGGYLALDSISSGAGKYSIENVQSVAEGFHSWHAYLAETRDQSGYSLGDIRFTPLGILSKAPEAFWVTYYRPFLVGDVRNIATLFEGIQTFALLILTLVILFKVGVLNFIKILITNKDVRAFMLFAIIFGVAVGITSYNFGALSRYKIPSLPFYTATLSIIYFLGYLKPKKEKILLN